MFALTILHIMRKIILYTFILLLSTHFSLFSQEKECVDSIMQKSMEAAVYYSGLVDEFEAEVYMRMYARTLKRNFFYKYTHLMPDFVLHNKNHNEGLIEVLSDLKFTHPNNYAADIKHVTGTIQRKDANNILPSSLIHLNVYSEMSSNERFFMPLRKSSKQYYSYQLTRTYTDNSNTYYTIAFTPKFKSPKLLKGIFVLEKDTWRIMQFVCEGVDLASEFAIELYMGNRSGTEILPVNCIIQQKFSYLGNVVTNRSFVNISYNLIKLKENRQKKENLNISNFYKVRLDSVPIKNDPTFWDKNRKIPLQAKEQDLIDELYQQSKNDTVTKKANNAADWAKNVALSSSYKYNNADIKYSGMFNPFLLGYSSFDGLTYRQKVALNFELQRQSSIEIDAFVGYMFKRKEIFTNITTAWNYNPPRLGKLSLSVGNGNKTYSSIYLDQVQDSIVSSGLSLKDINFDDFEYYNDYYFRLNNTIEVTNGFTIGTGLDYHIRKAAENKISDLESTLQFSALYTNEESEVTKMYKKQKIFAPVLTFTWTPEQYYRFERRQKIYVRSPYPTMKLELARGFQGVLGSTSGFNRVELDISQNIELDLNKSFHYHIGMGFFSNQKSEYFTDFKYFAKRNFPSNWDDGIGGVFNLLDRRFYNASDTYIQNHLMYESPFLILNLVPAVSRGVVTERLYFSHLYNHYIRSYTEFGYGIGNSFFNVALFGAFHKLKFHEIGFKLSLNIL